MPGLPYLRVLRRPGVTRLLGPALVARIPDSIAATAIVVLVRSVTGSYSAAGLAAGAFGVGTAVSAPLTGRAVDRLGQRRVLPVLAAGFAGALIMLVLSGGHLDGAAVAVLAAAAGLTRPPIEAALRALWPGLVSAAQLDAAYALDSTVQELIWIAGPLLLAVLLAVGNRQLPLIACAVLTIAGTVAYTTGLRAAPDARHASAVAASPLRQARLRVLLVCGACYGVSAGMLNLALVAFAGAHGGVAWAGVLVAIWGAGSLAGGLAYGSRDWKSPVEGRAMICLALFGATLMLLAAAPGLVVLGLLMVCLGVPLSPWLGSLSASVQRAASTASATEAFAWSFAVITVGMAGGNAMSGVVIQTANTAAAFAAAGGLSLAGALFGTWRLAGRRSHRPARRSGYAVGPGPAVEPPGVADTKPMNCSDGQSAANTAAGPVRRDDGGMRLLTFNTRGMRGDWAARLPVFREGFRALDPDIVTLQETILTDRVDQAIDMLGPEYHLGQQRDREPDGQGITTASKWPLGQAEPERGRLRLAVPRHRSRPGPLRRLRRSHATHPQLRPRIPQCRSESSLLRLARAPDVHDRRGPG